MLLTLKAVSGGFLVDFTSKTTKFRTLNGDITVSGEGSRGSGDDVRLLARPPARPLVQTSERLERLFERRPLFFPLFLERVRSLVRSVGLTT